ncbi:MAG TPA: hypothetical protein VEC39_09330 [Vicinamibacterales bacterium]|nr:hypothetical protein [Vicinamibacterales bacterium]
MGGPVIIISWLAWLLYLLVPTEGGMLDGLPLGPIDALGVLLVGWIAWHRARIPGWPLAMVITAAALVASVAVPGHEGLKARYFATATAAGAHERSVEFGSREFTRIDRQLQFARNRRDFPLAFFNDHTRFNFMRAGEPDRRYLGFAASWTGWWWSDGGRQTVFVQAPQMAVDISIDTELAARSNAATSSVEAEVTLQKGWHRLHVTLVSPYGTPREFSAGVIADGVRQPFGTATVRTERPDGRQHAIARALETFKPIVDAVALAWLAILAGLLLVRRVGEVWQRQLDVRVAALALVAAAGAVEALRFAWPWAERLRLLIAGDDTMVYEGYARDILLNGILMNGGGPFGEGEPFYFQAFYPYFLAATHAVFGESTFGAMFIQRLLVAATAIAATRIAVAITRDRAWLWPLLVSTAFLYWKLAPISADLLSESLYVPLLMWWTMWCVELCFRPTTRHALLAGLVGGLTAITRTTVLIAWPLVWSMLFVQLRDARGRMRVLASMAAVSLALFSLIAVRNGLVSGRFAPMPTEFGITLRAGNEPPGDIPFRPGWRMAVYERLAVGGHTAEVLEYAITSPRRFADNMGRKLLFVLGVYEPYAPGWGYSPVYIATWLGAIAGVWMSLRGAARTIPVLLPLSIAVTQFVVIVIVYPKGERLIVPIHTLLIPYAGIAAHYLWRSLIAILSPAASPSPPTQLPSSP